ncbi:MAG: DNA-binding protein [Candidatus Woesearchaeota archaeon]|jgi:programmed cell death protein 5|nr:DNA-binding protein [Candidatus Woesearchaeota archaeon]MDP7322664.1 DNA-binding protein [Candidatus Woesearchaeota archaeon]MDP7476643.1 DNA-binding protein [Candidatus Woesearchaeota archaeon]|tara:strand:- start:116 stop:448 length:333 start_codon:yes stop_codon:yes gene_type:complete
MSELDEIKQRKMEELKQSQLEQSQQQSLEEDQIKQQIAQLEIMIKQALTKDALQRYGNLKTASPDKAVQVLVILAQALQSGQITKVDDDTLKEILKKITPEKKDIKIKRV